tara:strand:+ start:851 stop:1234 length:384 start_codon:yes stop_codon:yes gene_type:complete
MSISDQAKLVASNFIQAFNAQDHQAIAKTLNYPHIRLAKGKFQTIANQEEFEALSERAENSLRNEGWDHTVVESMESIHVGEDKVHLSIKNHRVTKSGDIYNSFETLWIVTLNDEHWGIQFRSSYLK